MPGSTSKRVAAVTASARSLSALIYPIDQTVGPISARQIVQGLSHSRVARTQGLLHDRERALVEPLGLDVLALGLIHHRQIVQGLSHIQVARTQSLLTDRQR